jgi:hypothetical protein
MAQPFENCSYPPWMRKPRDAVFPPNTTTQGSMLSVESSLLPFPISNCSSMSAEGLISTFLNRTENRSSPSPSSASFSSCHSSGKSEC